MWARFSRPVVAGRSQHYRRVVGFGVIVALIALTADKY
jgi:hypothetical protein